MFLLMILMLAAWLAGYLIFRTRRNLVLRLSCMVVRVGIGVSAMLVVFEYLKQVATLNTGWPIWVLVILGAGGVELIVWLYSPQLRKVARRFGIMMVVLRAMLLLGVIVMLSQPSWTWKTQRKDRKTVAVLIDNSASMHVPQQQSTQIDRVRMAEATGKLKRPAHFDQTSYDIKRVSDELSDWLEWLVFLKNSSEKNRLQQFEEYHESFKKGIEDAYKIIESSKSTLVFSDSIKQKIPSKQLTKIQANLDNTKQIIEADVIPQFDELRKMLKHSTIEDMLHLHRKLSDEISKLIDTLTQANSQAEKLASLVDTAFIETLSPDEKAALKQTTAKTRYDIAWDVLARSRQRLGGQTYAPSLLQDLVENFDTRLITFSSKSQELDVTQWSDHSPMVLKDLPTSPDKLPPEKQRTDMSDAFRYTAAIGRDTSLAGVLVLSDMRHNTSDSVMDIVRYMSKADINVYPILVGTTNPPKDAAIVTVETPQSIFPEDDMIAEVKAKLTGLAGKPVTVNLYYKNKIVKSETITPKSNNTRKTIKLSHGPKKLGHHAYKVRIEVIDGEVLTSNNEYSFSIAVKDDKTRILLIDDRPRWEFRYLKNLFENRDQSVRFQYILLSPDTIAGQGKLPVIRPSVELAKTYSRATALPATSEEWMKFDIIIIGDVAPAVLGYDAIETLCEYVTQHGGTLVCIAGQNSMPNAYSPTKLTKVLPIYTDFSLPQYRSPDPIFMITLSDEGKTHLIMQQEPQADQNDSFWTSLPPFYWRSPMKSAKPSATVLAYAKTETFPKPPEASMLPSQRRQRMKEIDQYIRDHALITAQNVSLGKVLFMGFDQTWRLRYRSGDTYHHRFWGQVLRWAVADRMLNGTALVKIGTDKARYRPNQNVKVKARILDTDFSPLVTKEVPVNLMLDDKLVAHRKLKPDPSAPGMYYGDLGKINKGGSYKLTPNGKEVARILRHEGKSGEAFTVFSVDQSALDEQLELTLDTKLAREIAAETDGAVLTAANARNVLSLLGENLESHPVSITWNLWDSWFFLTLLIAIATGEWAVRKYAGLS